MSNWTSIANATFTLPACLPTSTCAPCYFGASTTLHSFPYEVSTLTVEVIPIVTPFANGSDYTSYYTTTSTETLSKGSWPGTRLLNPNLVTWIISETVVLTSPTTYVQYTDFYGATGSAAATATPTSTPETASTCAPWNDLLNIRPSAPVPVAPFILPLPSGASISEDGNGWNAVPTPILSYLQNMPWVVAVMGNEDLATCAATSVDMHWAGSATCTTEYISSFTTCVPVTSSGRFNATTCSPKSTTITVTSTVPHYGSPNSIFGNTYTSSPEPTIFASASQGLPTPAPFSSLPVATGKIGPPSSALTHETAHLLTTFTRSPFYLPIQTPGSTPEPGFSGTAEPPSGINNGGTAPSSAFTPPINSGAPPSGGQGLQHGSPQTVPANTSPSNNPGSASPPPALLPDENPPPTLSSQSSAEPALVVGSQTVLPGSTVNIGGTIISFAPSGGSVFVNGVPTSIPDTPITIGGTGVALVPAAPLTTALPELVAGTQTIVPGGVITMNGATVSLPASPGGTVYVNGQPTSISGSILTIAGTPFTLTTPSPGAPSAAVTVISGEGLLASGQTILPGQVVTTDGATISLPSSAAGTVYVNGTPVSIIGSDITIGTDVFTVTSVPVVTERITSTAGGDIFRASVLPSTPTTTSAGTVNSRPTLKGTWLGLVAICIGLTVSIL